MFAQKENRVYRVTEENKKDYLKRGFDILDEKGEVIESNPDKKISYAEHMKIVAELKAEIKELKESKKASKEGAKGKQVTEPGTSKEGAKDGKVQE